MGLLVLNLISMNAFADVSMMTAAKKAGWVAKDNWVTHLPREQIKRMMGVQKAPNLDAEFTVREGSENYLFKHKPAVPAALDWRNKDGVNWVSPILNQGNCGSCVSFSTVATLETQVNVSSGIPGLNPQFSTQALFSCGGGACDFGWQPQLAAEFLKTTGVPDEACSPYTEGATGVDVDCSATCGDRAARSLKIVDFTTPSNGGKSIDAVKAALQNGPLVTTLTVYDDFLFYSSGVYKHTTGGAAGGHAVSIVGYNDADRAWIVRNSWGPDWGENGFVRVSYDDISGVSSETWQFVLPKADGYVTLYAPKNRNFVSGTAHVSAESTFANTSKVDVTFTDLSGRTAYTGSCTTKACSLDVDTTTMKDGVYDAVAVAHVGDTTTELSQHEIFFIVNQAPTMPLSVGSIIDANGKTVDTAQPVTDRIVFNLITNASPVPYESLTFHVAQNGKDVFTKGANIVVQQGMTLGWRTGAVPNGTYDVYFTGLISPEGKQAYTSQSAHMTVTVANTAN